MFIPNSSRCLTVYTHSVDQLTPEGEHPLNLKLIKHYFFLNGDENKRCKYYNIVDCKKKKNKKISQRMQLYAPYIKVHFATTRCLPNPNSDFHRIGPLGRFDLVVAMSVCMLYVCCPFPMRFFSRPLIGPQIT